MVESIRGDTLINRRGIGALGEELACQSLRHRGYRIIERNWRCPRGEIDIVAQDGECWVFVEVKARRGRRTGLPEEAMTRAKIARVTELARIYLGEHGLGPVDWRIDLAAVELDNRDRVIRLNLVTGLS